jgi:rhamnosyltransferase
MNYRESNTNQMNIVAIVVTFEPEVECLSVLFDALIPQVNKIVMVDNSSSINLEKFVTSHMVEYVRLSENFGIAYAQNIGINWAERFGATHVLLMDQDSIPFPDMVSKLSSVFIESKDESIDISAIAAVGPSYIDSRNNKRSFFVIEKNHLPARWLQGKKYLTKAQIEVLFLISSGTLIPVDVLKKLGGLRSNYFIDHVDTEWSFRARSKGYRLLGIPDAQMQHSIGDQVKRVWFFGWRQVSYHNPLRDYYMFRNTLLMLRDIKIPLIWQLYFLWRLVQFFCYFILFSSHRLRRLHLMMLGLWHGVLGVSGKLDLETLRFTFIPK